MLHETFIKQKKPSDITGKASHCLHSAGLALLQTCRFREQHNIFFLWKQESHRLKMRYPIFRVFVAVWTGLEPATFAVTGRHSNQLNYQTVALNADANIHGFFDIANIFYKNVKPIKQIAVSLLNRWLKSLKTLY
jgi:hypothetical protein